MIFFRGLSPPFFFQENLMDRYTDPLSVFWSILPSCEGTVNPTENFLTLCLLPTWGSPILFSLGDQNGRVSNMCLEIQIELCYIGQKWLEIRDFMLFKVTLFISANGIFSGPPCVEYFAITMHFGALSNFYLEACDRKYCLSRQK